MTRSMSGSKFMRGPLLAVSWLILATGCASNPNEAIYHGFRYKVDVKPGAKNIRYRYGNLSLLRPKAVAGGGDSDTMTMPIPETFEISWETYDGKQHHAIVPVRSRIHYPIKGRNVLFEIKYDTIEGYVESMTAKHRFY